MNVNAWVAALRPGEDTLEPRSVVMPVPELWQRNAFTPLHPTTFPTPA